MKYTKFFDEFVKESRITSSDAGYEENSFANEWSDMLYKSLNSHKDTPIVTIKNWINNLEKTEKFTGKQLSDLEKDALTLRGMTNAGFYKQTIKNKLVKLLNNQPIR